MILALQRKAVKTTRCGPPGNGKGRDWIQAMLTQNFFSPHLRESLDFLEVFRVDDVTCVCMCMYMFVCVFTEARGTRVLYDIAKTEWYSNWQWPVLWNWISNWKIWWCQMEKCIKKEVVTLSIDRQWIHAQLGIYWHAKTLQIITCYFSGTTDCATDH